MRDPQGRLVAGPLLLGGDACLFHTSLFCVDQVDLHPAEMTVCFFDLETTGLDILTSEIVEIGAYNEHGASFSLIVKPNMLPDEAAGPPVHGITNGELQQGCAFELAFAELVKSL